LGKIKNVPNQQPDEVGTKISKQMVKTTDRAAALMPADDMAAAGAAWCSMVQQRNHGINDTFFHPNTWV
jgi:hypothetical protein